MSHDRIKHIDVKYHFTRYVISKGTLIIGNTQFNLSDMGTKVIHLKKFVNDLKLLSIGSM